ncbi:stage 0 sporulation protein YaaT [Endomicrobiia bacterium]|nr:stage 0 sporulation protein YaaT [Endomicrobiia bacterium]GHT67708.1 stage 0 sporulation protein YaaT [Endomicrobiia bacterium]GHT73976.1 stage 0 sporulation protein YaaT [Endomicrobiia bacterium]
MPIVIGVMLRKTKDMMYADVGHFDLKLNDKVILETGHGVEIGIICEKEKSVQKDQSPIGKILRRMTEEDIRRLSRNEKRNLETYTIVMKKAKDHKLDMKLTCVQHTFDRSKLFVYYTSEIRVDFRELIRDLGRTLKTRIQMVQIGARDESKMIGGIGICGQLLCCQSFLKNFNLVTTDMLKDQDLSSNSLKLTGLCNRLMCCISYENDTYRNVKKDLPDVGTMILTPGGKAKLVAIDCVKEKVTVDFGDRSFKIFTIKQIKDNNGLES